jgi:Flp pilus assembly protein TadG
MMISIRKLIKDKYSGLAALEVALTLPVLLMLIFFIIELIRINNTRTAMDSMALEAVLEFIATKSTTKFETIITKHKPAAIPRDNIKYYHCI